MDVDRFVAEVNALRFVEGDDQALLGDFFTVLVLGTSTSMPDCRMGAVIMKMISSTKTTSMNGTMLISESDVCVCLTCGIVGWRRFYGGAAKFQPKVFSICAATSMAKVSSRPARSRMLCKK